jgi:DNA polymerase/3'-5' exonuclease PolX
MRSNNGAIIEVLSRLMVLRELENQPYKVSAYQRVIQSIRSLKEDVRSGEDAQEKLSGVGKDIKKYIDEIIKHKDEEVLTGIKEIDDLDDDMFNKIAFIADVTSVHKIEGVGVKKAEKYFLEGVDTREALEEHLSSQGVGRQKKGLKYGQALNQRIPREEVEKFASFFQEYVNDENRKGAYLAYTLAGSYRRGLEDSGDVDFILWSENEDDVEGLFQNIVDNMSYDQRLLETLSFKKDMFQGIVYIDDNYPAVRMDVLLLKDKLELPYAMLYLTGNKTLNRELRTAAIKMGYHLGNTYMTDENGNNIIVEDEKEIFDLLGYDYYPPTERNW